MQQLPMPAAAAAEPCPGRIRTHLLCRRAGGCCGRLLVVLILALMAMLMWLAGPLRSQIRSRACWSGMPPRRSATSAPGCSRNVQSRRGAAVAQPGPCPSTGRRKPRELLHAQRELLRIEQRDSAICRFCSHVRHAASAAAVRPAGAGSNAQADVALACTRARRASGSRLRDRATSCPRPTAWVCRSWSCAFREIQATVRPTGLPGRHLRARRCILTEMVGRQLARSLDVTFTDPDGTRLAYPRPCAAWHARVHRQPPARPAG
jgi:two-component system sensor histidine kinase DctS